MDIMRSVVGMVVLLAIAFLLSVNKKRISLRTVGAALVLQIAIGGIMLYFPPGKWLVEQAALGVHKVMSYSDAGSAFIFGSLVGPKMDVLFDGAGFIFAFRVLPAIIFVTALISLLYYIGVMGLLIRILGGIFQKALNISKIESFVAVTTIFLGQNEIPAIVKPFMFADEGFSGVVIDVSALDAEIAVEDTVLTAGAGVRLAALCKAALKHGLSGLEFAYGIPGTVGGAVYMNAGAYGGEMKDVLTTVRYLAAEGEVREVPAAELDLRYRHSIFEENSGCILSAQFHLQPGNAADIRAKMDELMAKRVEKQPLDKPSAGSTFKRPAGAFAAALIDQCGLRGYRHGGAAVSDKHCGFVVNLGGATCADVLALCDEVRAIVKEKTGYDLEKEIRVVR